MGVASRYEIVGTIASGDFATVYRGRDRELGRDVAIKEIHPHFRQDPKQLERYWREAQLLATLQHPNIITIYDVVRPKGWLILELMRGNLQQSVEKGPIDLDFLREVLTDTLQSLDFLHKNGIIHGDIKPSNLLLDSQGRVKLGDFGLARRATDEHGSLLKGTTKYMAPELISAQFGPVGPASDLYSLGFTAYELMCGPDFDLLFPTLATFGRDRQIAWMMWHASADQKLPPIDRVLEGVPEDLAAVVDRLVQKNQQERIKSATEALAMLQRPAVAGVSLAPPAATEPSEEELQAQQKKKRTRLIAGIAVACSLILSVVMLIPSSPPPPPATAIEPITGTVEQVLLDARLLIIDRGTVGKEEREIRSWDEVFINDKKSLLRDIQPGDCVTINLVRDEQGRQVQRIEVIRPQTAVGQIDAIEGEMGTVTILTEPGQQKLVLHVTQGQTITLNDSPMWQGKTLTLADLAPGDRVEVEYERNGQEMIARKVAAYRAVRSKGIVRGIDAAHQRLEIDTGGGSILRLPWAADCVVTINGQATIGGKLPKPTDLLPNDQVEIEHDTQILRVDAYRVLSLAGVIQQVHYEASSLDVLLQGGKVSQVLVPESCEITLAGEPASLSDLRAGDQVDLQHDTASGNTIRALKLTAVRPENPLRYAVLVAVGEFDDSAIPDSPTTIDGVKQLSDVMIRRGAFPRNQTLVLTNPSRVRLEQALKGFLQNAASDAEIVLYYAGYAVKDSQGQVFLLCKESNLQQLAATALPVQTVADLLEAAPGKTKIWLLDVSPAAPAKAAYVAAEEALKTVQGPPGMAPFRTVTAIAGCATGEAINVIATGTLTADVLRQAYSGKADENRDGQITPAELYAFLSRQVPAAAESPQNPRIFLPDNRPPRLSPEAKSAIRHLAAMLMQDRLDPKVVNDGYRAALKLAGKELEPALLFGLLQIKMTRLSEAQSVLEGVKLERPLELVSYLGLMWIKLLRRDYAGAMQEAASLVENWEPSQVKPTPGLLVTPLDGRQVFFFLGQLREFAERAADESERPSAETFARLDDRVTQLGNELAEAYQSGRARSREIADRFDEQISRAPDEPTRVRIKYERRQIARYIDFPYDLLSRQIVAGLDR